MDGRPITADSKHIYPSTQLWIRSTSSPAVPRLSTISGSPPTANPQALLSTYPTNVELLPILFPQQSLYQAQLLQYNKLVAPGRGGGLQTAPLPPILSAQNVQVGPRSRSSSKVSHKDSRVKQGLQNCHGNRGHQHNNRGDRALITQAKDTPSKMPSKKADPPNANALPPRPKPSTSPSHLPPHSNSVPSTPQQHARKFSFGSREHSPNPNPSHSPRSVYSEANGTVPSLRPLPPRQGRCRYETGIPYARRRIPYNIGTDPLEKTDLNTIQSKLSEEDERRLTTDMRELYDRLQPTSTVEANRQKLVRKLEKLLNDQWPGHDIRVHLFGSSGNLLCSDDSDVDICIVTPWKELEDVCKIADLLAKHGMEKVICVSSAKVPIVKIWDPELHLACDLNVNNTLALENTRMIKTYVEIDDRIRPLAMIIKHWTRRRVVNDAAFGGTLSSYTWICMIIAFLQLRQPPVVPALHQRPHQKLPRKDGHIAAFADDVEKLRGFGDKNKSSLGELLFQFFRFYAHEFDYSTYILSVRLGKLIVKKDKKWHLALNNQLCVEEPFNTNRNLGNTADDTAFRGLHLELRRAFDLIAKGNLEECCEQFVFPKEEEKIFQKPPTVSRPVLLRSASQQHGGRGGRNGGNRGGNRQQGSYRNNGNNHNNRRASSSVAFDNNANAVYLAAGYPIAMNPQDATAMYMQTPEALAQTLSALQLQENNLRFLQYTQSQAFQQQQAFAHAQRMQGSVQQGQPSSAERSRTNSFDTPPLTAPLRNEVRPELQYFYPMGYQQAPFYGQQQHGFPTYPSSPSTNQTAEYRRTSHRSPVAVDASFNLSGSALRSQSQPASRSVAGVPSSQSYPGASHSPSDLPIPARHLNGIPMPSFIPDESIDTEYDGSLANTPPEKERQVCQSPGLSSPAQRLNGPNGVMPAFGDLGQSPRRLSSEQFPQSVLDRIGIKRTSRSPSPLGHGRALSVGTGSTSPAEPSQLSATPLVVNGSISKPPLNGVPARQPWATPSTSAEYVGYDNALHINPPMETASPVPVATASHSPTTVNGSSPASDRPVIVNGTTPIQASPHHLGPDFANNASLAAAAAHTAHLNFAQFAANFTPVLPALSNGVPGQGFPRFQTRQSSSPLIAQLDLATADRLQPNEFQHLSPVYEVNSPSPSFSRKLELPPNVGMPRHTTGAGSRGEGRIDLTKGKQKSQMEPASRLEASSLPQPHPKVNGLVRENGHVRGAKSESDNAGASGWQKIPRGRKKGTEVKGRNDAYPQSEQLPKNDSERKGG